MKKIAFAFFALLFTASLVAPVPVYADSPENPLCSQDGLTTEQKEAAGCNSSSDPANETFSTLRTVLNSVYIAVAIAAVGVIVFGGFRFTLSQGDPGKVKKAKDTIMYAIIGLIVVLSAFAITNFILGII